MWRHLGALDPEFAIPEWETDVYGLWCNKPVYGLNDAPVAWQLSLGVFLSNQRGCPSRLDDSFYFWKLENHKKQTFPLKALLTTHVVIWQWQVRRASKRISSRRWPRSSARYPENDCLFCIAVHDIAQQLQAFPSTRFSMQAVCIKQQSPG